MRSRMQLVRDGLLICALLPASQVATAQQHGLDLRISAAPQALQGREIKLVVELKNVSAHEMRFGAVVNDGQAEMNYDISVRRVDGTGVSESSYYRLLKRDGAVASHERVDLNSGAVLTESTILTNLFDMSKPGHYIVSAKRHMNGRERIESVSSNELAVDVTP